MTQEELWRELGCPERPEQIWQKEYELGDPDHQEGLNDLCQTAETLPRHHGNLYIYLDILTYGPETQLDLLLFLLPQCLRAWSVDLLGERIDYKGYAERFWFPWYRNQRNPAKHKGLFDLLSKPQQQAFQRYVIEVIIEAIDRGGNLRNVGADAYCHRWLREVVSFASLSPGLPQLWNKWWNLDTDGRAIGALQYISCLMYERTVNPIFPAWTPNEGGGPMTLGALGYGPRSCDPENIRFLQDVLAPQRLFSIIDRCQQQLTNPEDVKVAAQMKADFAFQLPLLKTRLEQLPAILSGENLLI